MSRRPRLTVRARLTLIGQNREGEFDDDVLLSRSRYLAPASQTLRFYREYFKPSGEKIIEKERPDALLPTMGGQTALNCALDLAKHGVLEKYGVEMIGANAKAIERGEDRQAFKDTIAGFRSGTMVRFYIYRPQAEQKTFIFLRMP